eukprot:gb/GECH01005354.1/.p1 GENE.gb/GECH01005354.1/~~gb/GECH01005354.1/.p1  ORF type:complete len:119 (+),score=17.02 gb/GECH01005354.1/:1-357(+)
MCTYSSCSPFIQTSALLGSLPSIQLEYRVDFPWTPPSQNNDPPSSISPSGPVTQRNTLGEPPKMTSLPPNHASLDILCATILFSCADVIVAKYPSIQLLEELFGTLKSLTDLVKKEFL